MKPWAHTIEQLIAENGPALFGYAYVLTGDRHRAEDLVQDAIVRTFSRGRASMSMGEAHNYVTRAISSAFIDGGRRAKARPVTSPLEADVAQPDHAGSVVTELTVHAAVLTLPPRERACIVLRYLEDLSVEAVARELGLAQGTVKRYVSDGMARLRALDIVIDGASDDALTGGRTHVAVTTKGQRS